MLIAVLLSSNLTPSFSGEAFLTTNQTKDVPTNVKHCLLHQELFLYKYNEAPTIWTIQCMTHLLRSQQETICEERIRISW